MRRKITLLLILALSTVSAFAHSGRGASKLNLLLFDDGNFTVLINGVRYPNVNGNLQVPGMFAGTHHVKIVEVFYGRRGQRRGREVLYAGPLNIPYNSRVTVRLTQNNRLRTVRVDRLQHQHRHYRGQGPRYDVRRNGQGYGPRNGNGYGYGPRNGTGYGPRNGNRGGQGFNQRNFQFNQAKQAIRRAPFEQEKLSLARETARTQNLSAFEVAEIMNMMSFESTRLKFAKYAYRFSPQDPNYLHVVSRSLDFSSSRRELARFIRTF